MVRAPLRIATTAQLTRAVHEAGYQAFLLPNADRLDSNRSMQERVAEGSTQRAFLEVNNIDLVIDLNAAAMTFLKNSSGLQITAAALGIPYVACYLDPVTAAMPPVAWDIQWQILESDAWIKWIWESGHSDELRKLGVPNVITMPLGAFDDDFDATKSKTDNAGPIVTFMGPPATSWFRSTQAVDPAQLLAGLTAAAVRADMPNLAFHKIYYDLYSFDIAPLPGDDLASRAGKSVRYFNQKFIYSTYLAVKQCDRFARFLKTKLGDAFELIGDRWGMEYNLPHAPRIDDRKALHQRMREVPICLNLMNGDLESGLNLRHFEITACGGFLLAYLTPELSSCFEIGEECDVFRDEAELLEKIHYYMEHAERRREIARAGQQRTLRNHCFSHRIRSLVHILEKHKALPQRTVPGEQTVPA